MKVICNECGMEIQEDWINKGTPGEGWDSCPHYACSISYEEDEE